MKHANDIPDDFWKVDRGAPTSKDKSDSKSSQNRMSRGETEDDTNNNADEINSKNEQNNNLPLCL